MTEFAIETARPTHTNTIADAEAWTGLDWEQIPQVSEDTWGHRKMTVQVDGVKWVVLGLGYPEQDQDNYEIYSQFGKAKA